MGNTCSMNSFNCLAKKKKKKFLQSLSNSHRFSAPKNPEEFTASVLNTGRFNYKELCKATDNFRPDNKIGAGGFGTIYKGVLGDGTLATLKVLENSHHYRMAFVSEIDAIANLEHENLVKMLGFCAEGEHIILVFKYLKNGNLIQTLFSKETHVIDWSWPMRRRICTGVAKGIRFLHEKNIVHGDIKPSNILLDDQFVPKISDFGISKRLDSLAKKKTKRLDSDIPHTTTQIAGTMGYKAPEYISTGCLTKKVDVYSFGILVLEIVSGRRQITSFHEKHLLDIAWELYEKGELITLVDESMDTSLDVEEACSYLEIGLLCTQDDFRLRPSISTVLEMLRGKCEVNTNNISRLRHTFDSDVTPGKSKYDITTMISSDSSLGNIENLRPLIDLGKKGFLSPGNDKDVMHHDSTSLSTSFTYEEVKIITTNFSHKIASTDGDASVYFGFITKELRQQVGPRQVTVQVYDVSKYSKGHRNEFRAQVDLLKKISHPNLVKILGHCFTWKYGILIHEIMARGSLADNLYSGSRYKRSWKYGILTRGSLADNFYPGSRYKRSWKYGILTRGSLADNFYPGSRYKRSWKYGILTRGSLADNLYSGEWSSPSWLVRVNIAIDAARGLAHLHENERPIIHGHFKPSNILMDMDYNAKVIRFGPEGAATSLGTFGYAGYAAPECSGEGRVSTKGDVYSFGLVLIELLSGRRWTANELLDWSRQLSRETNVLRIMDARLKGKYPIRAAEDVAKLACECLDDNPQRRPSMGDIVDSLKILLEDDHFITKEDSSTAFEGSSLSLPSVSNTTELQNQLEICIDSTVEPNQEIRLLDLEIRTQDEGTILMLGSLGLTEAPKPEEWLNAREIYLMNNLLRDLPQSPKCPILSMLFLQGNCKLRMIPTNFFGSMPCLQVLNLSQTRIKTLPDSIFELHHLKSLYLRHCGLFSALSPKIGQLHQLEVLDLEGTEIVDLPKEIQNLTNLVCLKLSFYGDFSPESKQSKPEILIHQGTISALSQLGELSIDVNPGDERWEVEAIFKEVCGLTSLHTLKLYFPTVTYLRFFKRPLCLRFRFTVGPNSNRIMSRLPQDLESELEQWDRCLRFINGEDDGMHDIHRIVSQSSSFFLDRHKTATKLSSFGLQKMQQLRHCIVGECNAMEYLIDGMSDFKSLESLHLYYMKNLKGICSTGPVHTPCLDKLKVLTLQTCPRLIVVFTPELLNNLINLEELKVEDCEVATSLVMCRDKSDYEGYCFLPKLKRLSLQYLPELSSIANGLLIAPELEWLSLCDCPSLRSLKEVGSRHLRRIEGERSWWEGIDWSDGRPVGFEDIFCAIEC